MIRSLLKRTAASSAYARRHMLVGATSIHTHQTYFKDNNLYQQNRQLSSRVRSNNNNSRAGRTGGRGRGGHIGGRGRGSGRGRFDIDKSSGRGSGRGRGRLDRRHDSGPPTVEKGKMTSITVAAKKGTGATKYCYGCGAKIVSTKDIDTLTQEAGAKVRDKHASGDVQMGLKSSKGGFWNEQKDILNISKIKNWALCPRCKELQKKSVSGTIDNQLLKELSPSHEMTEIFREQVSKIRSKENAVVVLCCDAVNPRGSLINGIRNYIGGNPILLAVTRCDLLPEYVTENWSIERQAEIKKFYKRQAKELNPADVYLCSVNDVNDQYEEDLVDGSQRLSSDLLKHLNGRDTYVIGAANIGKSTLTDRLINNIIKTHQLKEEAPWAYRKRLSKKEEKKRRYGRSSEERLEEKRYKTVQDARVTKSSIPGTTLNNVRIPCFSDHTQALFDTPGLLLDPSLKHYPIRDFARIKAMKPCKIVPQWHNSGDRKSFALLVYEKSDQQCNTDIIPLLRVEIRLRKPKDNQRLDDKVAPVQLVWNSIVNPILSTSISSIEEAHSLEDRIEKDARDAAQKRREEAESNIDSAQRTPEEKAKEKETKRKLFNEKKRKEIAELGYEKYATLQKKKEDELHQQKQLKLLSTLSLVKKEKLKAGKPSELSIEHFGSLGILSPSCSALVMVYAPSSGIFPSFHDIMTVPGKWEADISDVDDETDDESDDELDDFDFDTWNNAVTDYAAFEPIERDHGVTVDDADDIWSEYKGEKVGWRFDNKPRYVKGKFVDGWQPIEDKNN